MTDAPTIKAQAVTGYSISGNTCLIDLTDDAGRPIALEMTFSAAVDLIHLINLHRAVQGLIGAPPSTPQKAH
jgi:hypothetical protein